MAGSRERPEIGVFTQTHAGRPPVPWGQITPGEEVLVKLARGPIVARARVEGFRQLETCSATDLRRATVGYGLHALDAYWSSLPPLFRGMAIYLRDEVWHETPYEPAARSRGASWIVVHGEARRLWEGSITERAAPATLGHGGRGVPARIRFAVLLRDGFKCMYCGRAAVRDGVVLHVDHVVPVAQGGPTVVENLRTACADCNLGKGARPIS